MPRPTPCRASTSSPTTSTPPAFRTTAYDRLRREAPVAWINETAANGHTGTGFWAVTRWDELVAVHKDWRTYSSEVGGTEIEELAADAIEARKTMLETDPPRHTRLRQLVNPAFSKSMVATYSDSADPTRRVRARRGARTAPSSTPSSTSPERCRSACSPASSGFPTTTPSSSSRWADQIVYHADPDYSAAVVDAVDTDPYRLLPFRSPVSERVFDYVERIIAARGQHPAGDVISVLADAAVDGEPLTARERGTFFLLLLIAGNETTRHSLSHALIAFAERPDELERLRADPALLDRRSRRCSAGPVRRCTSAAPRPADTQLAGVPIAAGDKVVTWYVAANFDPAQFADPHRFDVGRSPNRHVTFGGGGPHLCLGQWMARLEVRVFLEALVRRVDHLELAGPVERVRSNFINGVKRLPIAWRAR